MSSVEEARRSGQWTTRRALVGHVALLIWIPGCIVATWWQLGVARSGDSLGWVYSVMWPFFACFGVVFWWYLIHDDPETVGKAGVERMRRAQVGVKMVETAGDAVMDRSPDSDSDTDARRDADAVARAEAAALARAEAEDPELAAYNEYLAALARADRPGTAKRR